MKRNEVIYFIAFFTPLITGAGLSYLFAAFVQYAWSPAQWTADARLGVVIFALVVSVVLFVISAHIVKDSTDDPR